MYIWYGSLGEPTNENPKKQSKTISNFLKKLWKASFVVSILKFSSKSESSENCGASLNIGIPDTRKKSRNIVECSFEIIEKERRKKQENVNRHEKL